MNSLFSDPAVILLVSLVVVVGSIIFLRVGAFIALLAGALTVSFWTSALSESNESWVLCVSRVGEALGTTAGKIGMLIVFGTIIGKCMTDAGSADRIALGCRRLFGEKRVSAALAGGAFVLSIPVFYDATFYLLLPLAKSVYRSLRKNYVLYLLAVGLGATISHTIIPPTPGPIAVAQTLGTPLSTSLGIGLAVGICLFPVALGLAWLLNKILPNPKIDPIILDEIGLDKSNDEANKTDDLTRATVDDLPPLWLALTPIVLPVALISFASIVKASGAFADSPDALAHRIIEFLGDSTVALGLASIVACLTTLFSRKRRCNRSMLESKLNAAITTAGAIVLITAAGGAYGTTLRESGIGERIQELFASCGGLGGATALTLAFLSTALLKSAQGSSTTAMITAASIFASMNLTSESLGCNIGYLGATIGVGSSVASWMNDSGFCLFSRSSGISEVDCLKTWTLGTGLLGVAGFVVVLALSRLFALI